MQKNVVRIRRLEKSDMEQVIELLQDISDFSPDRSLGDLFDDFKSQPTSEALVAHIGTEIVGFGSIMMVRNIRGGLLGHVEDIVTKVNFRDQGVASAIIDSLCIAAQNLGCYKVVLASKSQNVDFYKKKGFSHHGKSMKKELAERHKST